MCVIYWILLFNIGICKLLAQQECAPDGKPGYELDPCNLYSPCVSGYIVPKGDDCAKYQMCTNGIWATKDCPPPMLFSKLNFICCTHMDREECYEECPTRPPGTPPPSELCDNTPPYCDEEERAPDKNYCDRYFQCLFGEWIQLMCPVGTAFDPVTSECTEDVEEANCPYRCLTSAAPTTTVPTTTQRTTTRQMSTTSDALNITDIYDNFTEPLGNTEEQFTDIYLSGPTEEKTETSTRPTTTTTTSTTTTTTTTGATTTSRDGNPSSDRFPNAVLIGSVCGAAAAIVIVVVAILAQNGILRHPCRKPLSESIPPSTRGPLHPQSNGHVVQRKYERPPMRGVRMSHGIPRGSSALPV